MSTWGQLRESARYWIREGLRGIVYRQRLRARGIDVGFVALERLHLDPSRAHDHSNSGGPDLERVLRNLGVTADDSIIDLGCGKGGALMTIAAFPFGRIAGLELSEEMFAVARENLQQAGAGRVELIAGDASEFHDYDGFSHIYMYNPFPEAVMRRVVGHLRASLERSPRKPTVIYKNPQCHDAIIGDGTFELLKTYDHSGHPFYVYGAVARGERREARGAVVIPAKAAMAEGICAGCAEPSSTERPGRPDGRRTEVGSSQERTRPCNQAATRSAPS